MFPSDTKVLIIDDSSFSRNVVKNGLKELSFWKIFEAESAETAQELILEEEKTESPISLIFCDIHMPKMTGIDFVRWLRSREETRGVPVIILTSSQEKAEVVQAAMLNVSHFLIKPFNLAAMKERLESAWDKHGRSFLDTAASRKI